MVQRLGLLFNLCPSSQIGVPFALIRVLDIALIASIFKPSGDGSLSLLRAGCLRRI